MPLANAQQIVARASQTAANSATKEMLKEMLEVLYADIIALVPNITIEGGSSAVVPEGGGTVSVEVRNTPGTYSYLINLDIDGEG